ncbi:glycosyltransferase [Paracoccus sp. p3-h83]|uniref:glycosyltransferase n=1 Tax=Paracoccus sp. p3-h83 TaxID=3342805 RepID=UPI0035BAF0DC
MKILLVHQNFPGQFPRLSIALKNRGHEVLALTDPANERTTPIQVAKYKPLDLTRIGSGMHRHFAEACERGLRAGLAARALRDKHGFVPDVILGHSGWGETLFLKEVWPDATLIVYSEMMFRSRGLDVGFDPEFADDPFNAGVRVTTRQAHLLQALAMADHGVTPTRFQRDSHPPMLHPKLTVLHDGIDTARLAPNPQARLTLADGTELAAGQEILTFLSRSLEPYRGFHIFMRALPQILAARPDARVVIVGKDKPSYGTAPKDAANWREWSLAEVGDRLDMSRVHFTGMLPYGDYVNLLHVSRAHVYLTYPFVLSWSLLESMAAGCQIIASDTAPVREVMAHGDTGLLVDFFDVDALARTVAGALADPTAGAERRARARQHVLSRYRLEDCLPRWIRLLESRGQIAEEWPAFDRS